MSKQSAIYRPLMTAAIVLLTAGGVLAQGQFQEVPWSWAPEGLRRLTVTSAKASSTASLQGGPYVPSHIRDGSRGTKWVANVAPSEASPQWITLDLLVPQEVAAVAAKHFKPLEMDIIQLDHGWQRGDVCGDWVGNKRFPHGLKWLAEQLQSRYGMKLGLWIAPSVVAETPQLFREHPDWLFTDAQGKPKVSSRWFWKSLDLFDREIPSVWHIHCNGDAGGWDVVGLFNFEDRPQQRTVELAALGLPKETRVSVLEFWEEKFLGVCQNRVTLKMEPLTSRILLIHRLAGRPQVIGTNMHLLGGYHELKQLAWDKSSNTLSGQCRRAAGLSGRVFVYLPPGYRPRSKLTLHSGFTCQRGIDDSLWILQLDFKEPELKWSIQFNGPSL